MQADSLRHDLDSPEAARAALAAWGVRDPERGQRNLATLSGRLGPDCFGQLAVALARLLPRCADPDRALNNLEHFFGHRGGGELLGPLLDNRARALEILLGLFS